MTTANAKLDTFTEAYVIAALWSSTDHNDEPMDKNYGIAEIAPEALEKMIKDCAEFQEAHWADISDDLERAGHDFWLTRNGHGAGFWDGDWPEAGDRLTDAAHAFGDVDLYISDDGQVWGM